MFKKELPPWFDLVRKSRGIYDCPVKIYLVPDINFAPWIGIAFDKQLADRCLHWITCLSWPSCCVAAVAFDWAAGREPVVSFSLRSSRLATEAARKMLRSSGSKNEHSGRVRSLETAKTQSQIKPYVVASLHRKHTSYCCKRCVPAL